MKDCVVSKALLLVQWSLLLLSLVVRCEARCSFFNYTADALFINMQSCGLTTINTAELTQFTNLRMFILYDNSLTTFPDVSPVGSTLGTLNLGKNQISNISDDVFIHLKALHNLHVYNNDLTTLPNVSAVGTTLKLLDLQYNQITYIDDDVFIHLETLETLRVYNNHLTTFPNVSAVGTTLKLLDLTNNQITYIDDDVFTHLTALESLRMGNNRLTSFPNVSAVCTTLKLLDLQYNQITYIDDDVFIHLTALESLLMENNRLTTFPNLTAVGTTLNSYDLIDNQITHISDDVLIHLILIDSLFMDGNSLTTFPDLSGVGTKLKIVSLCDNQLIDVSDDAFLTLVTLEELDLHNNPSLTHFPHPVQGLRNIKQLWIYDTGISHLPPILHENIAALELNIERSVDLCMCENAWLKQEGPKMADFQYDDADCDGQLWSNMTVEDMIAKCTLERQQKHKQLTQTNEAPTGLSLSPFLLHSFEGALSRAECTIECMDTTGCVSFYWRLPQCGAGDCVLIAPGNSINVSSVPEGDLPVWTYFSLT